MNFRIEVPESVKQAARKGLSLRHSWRRGGTHIGERTAKRLVRSRYLPGAFVRHIAAYFPRHAGDNLRQTSPPSNGLIAWLLWGGDPGRRWSNRAIRYMDRYERLHGR